MLHCRHTGSNCPAGAPGGATIYTLCPVSYLNIFIMYQHHFSHNHHEVHMLKVNKELIKHENPQGMQAFIFNTRKKKKIFF